MSPLSRQLRPAQDDFWRSLEELADTPGFRERLADEFPRLLPVWDAPIDRRSALKLLGASLMLAGLGGCGDAQPPELIVPYVRQPAGLTPGIARHYATCLPHDGYALGVIVASREGRPVKIEGNPRHPASLGACDAVAQAQLLGLYDPDRSRTVLEDGIESTWSRLFAALAAARLQDGQGLHLLSGPVRSPSLGRRISRLLAATPGARWHIHDPLARGRQRQGLQLAFGTPLDVRYRFDRAHVVLCLDADFLQGMPGNAAYARQFADGRRLRDGATRINRLYCIESSPTLAGAMADHRYSVRAGEIESIARALAARLGTGIPAPSETALPSAWLDAVVADLEDNRGAALVVPGDYQPPVVHAIAHAINVRLEGLGHTVETIDPVLDGPRQQAGDEGSLAQAITSGEVKQLLVLDVNPVYTDPSRDWAQLLATPDLTLHWGLYRDETARHCRWHVPALHALESWGDLRAYDGSVALQQPLIRPLYGGRSAHQVLAALDGNDLPDMRSPLAEHWRAQHPGDFDAWWRDSLLQGVVADSAAPMRRVDPLPHLEHRLPPPRPATPGIEVMLRPDPFLGDGRQANNAWLQELPRPLTQLCWDNAALIAPATAQQLGLVAGQRVTLRTEAQAVTLPVFPLPGHARDALTVHLGYGRPHGGSIAAGVGSDVYPLRDTRDPWLLRDIRLDTDGSRFDLANTQTHHAMHGRRLARHARLADYLDDPALLQDPQAEDAARNSLYPQQPPVPAEHAWGMVVDTGACIGCKACVAACQAENNIPVVGREQVLLGREMHWLRVDVWYQGSADAPRTLFQPVPCMHCEKAPCEYVCPVGATLHSNDGLNAMIYNRCVGTRYCSQNCPYKVRRFNYFDFAYTGPTPAPARNPEVTVRSRGVMEKCSYCIQRISAARIAAKKAGGSIPDGAIRSACQQACPTDAIVFGDLSLADSEVARYRRHPLNYRLLEELGTRPRTSYLGRISNPNPQLEDDRETQG